MEENLKNEEELKNEDYLKNEDNLKNKDNIKMTLKNCLKVFLEAQPPYT